MDEEKGKGKVEEKEKQGEKRRKKKKKNRDKFSTRKKIASILNHFLVLLFSLNARIFIFFVMLFVKKNFLNKALLLYFPAT